MKLWNCKYKTKSVALKKNEFKNQQCRYNPKRSSTVQNWEQGRRRPTGPALALLRIAEKCPADEFLTLRQKPNKKNSNHRYTSARRGM